MGQAAAVVEGALADVAEGAEQRKQANAFSWTQIDAA